MVRVIISVLVVAILLPAFLLGCNNTDNAEGENSMMPKATMPSIDALAPTETETATFALG